MHCLERPARSCGPRNRQQEALRLERARAPPRCADDRAHHSIGPGRAPMNHQTRSARSRRGQDQRHRTFHRWPNEPTGTLEASQLEYIEGRGRKPLECWTRALRVQRPARSERGHRAPCSTLAPQTLSGPSHRLPGARSPGIVGSRNAWGGLGSCWLMSYSAVDRAARGRPRNRPAVGLAMAPSDEGQAPSRRPWTSSPGSTVAPTRAKPLRPPEGPPPLARRSSPFQASLRLPGSLES